jgi:hypothetical protein
MVSFPRFSPLLWVAWPLIVGCAASPPTTALNGAGVETSPVLTEADARRLDLLKRNARRVSDPELADEFARINDRYFSNALPTIPVVWEPELTEIGELTAKNFTLKGITNGKIILLNVGLKRDRAELRRVLCHEMVHQHLFTIGDATTTHGPAFQAVLHRLSEEGAFEGISAAEGERTTLRSWLAEESKRFHREEAELTRLLERINQDQRDQHDAVELSRRGNDFNERVAAYNADVIEFNRRTNRYNSMMSYPDGLDEESLVQQKSAR